MSILAAVKKNLISLDVLNMENIRSLISNCENNFVHIADKAALFLQLSLPYVEEEASHLAEFSSFGVEVF